MHTEKLDMSTMMVTVISPRVGLGPKLNKSDNFLLLLSEQFLKDILSLGFTKFVRYDSYITGSYIFPIWKALTY